MLIVKQSGPHLCDGVTRREWLRMGALSLGGITLPQLLQDRAQATTAGRGRAKSVIILFNTGGIPHHETWDPKPDAPAEIRGAFGAISTRTPGLFVGELMPRSAELTEHIAVVRTMVTGDNAHSTSGYQMLTGVPHVPLNRENAGPGKPNDWPAMNALVRALRPPRGGLPSSIALPRRLANNGGQDPWPGTDAGFLGRHLDPWLLECDPSADDFTVPGGEFREGMSSLRLDHRRSLLNQLNGELENLRRSDAVQHFDTYQQQALDLIGGGQAQQAFDLTREPDVVRERYGRNRQGQSVLLARRLVEAGVSLVQVHWSALDKSRPNSGGWDTHIKHNPSLKDWLMPIMDQVYSALIEDLIQRGMLDETLVCWVSEFGHTPKFNAREGRDHWGRVFSIALAGGGIKGGVVYGATDAHAAEPRSDIVRPCDYLATVFHCLGYGPETMVHDPQGRPFPITQGRVVEELLA
jgi:hypothetical protein